MPAPMASTVFCVTARRFASSGESVRGSDRRKLATRIASRLWMLSAALMIAAIVRCPSVVGPRSIRQKEKQRSARTKPPRLRLEKNPSERMLRQRCLPRTTQLQA